MIPPGSTRRAIIEGGPEGLEIIIPAGRNLFAVVFLGVWLVGWLVGEVTAIVGLAGIASAVVQSIQMLFGSVGGIVTPSPRIGVSFSIATSDLERPNNSPALAACGLVSFIWPRMAPTISTSE